MPRQYVHQFRRQRLRVLKREIRSDLLVLATGLDQRAVELTFLQNERECHAVLAEIDSLRGRAITCAIALPERVAQRYAVWVGTLNGCRGVSVTRFNRAYAPFREVIEPALVGALPCQLDEKRFSDLNQAALPHSSYLIKKVFLAPRVLR